MQCVWLVGSRLLVCHAWERRIKEALDSRRGGRVHGNQKKPRCHHQRCLRRLRLRCCCLLFFSRSTWAHHDDCQIRRRLLVSSLPPPLLLLLLLLLVFPSSILIWEYTHIRFDWGRSAAAVRESPSLTPFQTRLLLAGYHCAASLPSLTHSLTDWLREWTNEWMVNKKTIASRLKWIIQIQRREEYFY